MTNCNNCFEGTVTLWWRLTGVRVVGEDFSEVVTFEWQRGVCFIVHSWQCSFIKNIFSLHEFTWLMPNHF